MFTSVCPIFPSQDFAVTITFYERLGFRLCFMYEAEGYLIIQRNDVELHFYRANSVDPTLSDHAAFVRVTDAQELSNEFQLIEFPTEGIPRVCKAENKPWGICELAVVDPDGNLLRVGHILND